MIKNSISKIYKQAMLSPSLLRAISLKKFCETINRADPISLALKENRQKSKSTTDSKVFKILQNPAKRREKKTEEVQPPQAQDKEVFNENHVFDQSIIEENNKFMLDLIDQNKLSFEDSAHNNEFCDFLEVFEKFMQSSNSFRKDLAQSRFEINNLVVNGRKPLNEIIDTYFNFTNKYGFEPRLLTEAFSALKEVVVNRRCTNSPAYFDYSDYDLIFSRKLYHLVDDLKFGITQSRSFLSYSQIDEIISSLREIGYKNTELLEMILQRINFDVANKVLMEFGTEHTDVPISVFENDCFNKSYKQINGFWPGEGKVNYHHYYNSKMELSKYKKFDEFLIKLMKIKTESSIDQILNESKQVSRNQVEISEDISDDIQGLLESLKASKSAQLNIVDSVKSIVEQFEKIKHFFINNKEFFKNNVQVRYEFIFLQNKLAQIGFKNLDMADPSRKLILDSTVNVLKEFAALEYPDLFNLEIEKFSQIVDQAVGEKQFISNNNTLNSLNHLSLLLDELTVYSKIQVIDVNKHDFFNSKFFNVDKQIGDENIRLNDSADQTISSKLNEKWLERIVNVLTNQYLQGDLAINNFHNAICFHSILKLSNTIKKTLKVDQALSSLLSSKLLKEDLSTLSNQYINSINFDINRPTASDIVDNMRQLASLIHDSESISPSVLNEITERLVFDKVESHKNRVENLILMLGLMIKFNIKRNVDLIIEELEKVHALEVSVLYLNNHHPEFQFILQYTQLYLCINKISNRLSSIDLSKKVTHEDICTSALSSYYSASCKGFLNQISLPINLLIKPQFVVGFLGHKIAVFFDYIYPTNNCIQNSETLSALLLNDGILAVFINPKKYIQFNGVSCSLSSSNNLVPLHEEILNELTLLAEKNPTVVVKIKLTKVVVSNLNSVTKELSNLYNKINEKERFSGSKSELKLIIQKSKELVQLIQDLYSSFNSSMLKDVLAKLDEVSNFLKKVESKELIASLVESLGRLIKETKTYVSLISLENDKSNVSNPLAGKRLGVSVTASTNINHIQLLNLKFLWHNKYAPYADWKTELHNSYDKFNYQEKANASRFYFENNNRLVPQTLIPDPDYFRSIEVEGQNKDLTVFARNNKLNAQFSSLSDDLKLKVNIMNITHHIKSKKSNQEILSFITSFDFIEKLKLEKIEEMKSKSSIKENSRKLLRRDEAAFADFLAELETINPNIDDFSKTALLEEENSVEFLKYEPSMNYKEREDYLVAKFEKWLEINTDADSLNESSNRVHYKFKTDIIKQVIQKIQIEAKEKVQEILTSNKLQLLFERRLRSERNLILLSMIQKLVDNNDCLQVSATRLSQTDLEYLSLILIHKDIAHKRLTRLDFKDLTKQDISKLEKLGNSVSLSGKYQDYCLNEIIFEFSNFVDSTITDRFYEDILLDDKSLKGLNQTLRQKRDDYNVQSKLELTWFRQLQLNQEGKEAVLGMYFINKNGTKFEKSWIPSTSKLLSQKIENLNSKENQLININSLIRKSDREFYDLIYWPHQVDQSKTTVERYNEIKYDFFLAYLEKKIGKKKEELKLDSAVLNQFIKHFLETVLANLVESYKTIEGLRLCFYDILSKDEIDLIEMIDDELRITETIKYELHSRLSKTDDSIKLEKNFEKDLMSSFAKVELPAIHLNLVEANNKI